MQSFCCRLQAVGLKDSGFGLGVYLGGRDCFRCDLCGWFPLQVSLVSFSRTFGFHLVGDGFRCSWFLFRFRTWLPLRHFRVSIPTLTSDHLSPSLAVRNVLRS